jgi:hypothetical protein
LKFVLLIGVMSFFADFTYQGSRSIIGPYLGLPGTGVLAIAMVTGAGEPLGYGLRLFSLRLRVFTGIYGIAWFVGSTAVGALFSISLTTVVLLRVIAELAAIPLILLVARRIRA